MSTVHVYAATPQPATAFKDHTFDPPVEFTYGAHRAIYCGKCRRRRWAAHLVAHVYYDQINFFFAIRFGCSVPKKRKQ